ncbi:MAG: PQQ-binding-like beta-propeller repeat protein [Vicinamibacterales bacterium]
MAILLALTSLGSAPKTKPLKPEPLPILPAEEVWTAKFDVPPAANAFMDGERVYVPLQVRGIRALVRATGAPLWSEPVDLTHPPLGAGGQLLIALPSELRALDPATGGLRWVRALDRPLAAELTATNGLVLAVTDAGDALAIRAEDGETVWRRSLGAVSRHVPAWLSPATAVLTLADGRVMALDARSGATVWERSLPGTPSAPATARDRVFVGSTNNFFYALDARSGDERWRWRTGGDVVGAAADGERVYFVSLDNLLRAVNRDNGNQLWKTSLPTRPSAPPMAFGDTVVLTGVAPRFDAYNGKTGAALGSFTAPADLQGVPLIDRTPIPFQVAIVALTRDGRLSALRPTGLMFPDPPLVPLLKLPGRELPKTTPNFQLPTPNPLNSQPLNSPT